MWFWIAFGTIIAAGLLGPLLLARWRGDREGDPADNLRLFLLLTTWPIFVPIYLIHHLTSPVVKYMRFVLNDYETPDRLW